MQANEYSNIVRAICDVEYGEYSLFRVYIELILVYERNAVLYVNDAGKLIRTKRQNATLERASHRDGI